MLHGMEEQRNEPLTLNRRRGTAVLEEGTLPLKIEEAAEEAISSCTTRVDTKGAIEDSHLAGHDGRRGEVTRAEIDG
jgi:hypothetical protein